MAAQAAARRGTDQDQRVAIVTGASSGIGRATARALAQRGMRVVLAARRADRLEALAEEIVRSDGQAVSVPGDITEPQTRRALVTTALERFGRLDILINNAGMAVAGTTEALSSEDIRAQFELNVFAALELTRLALPELRRRRGIAINVASLAGRVAMPPVGVYSATKFALAGWTEALRRELANSGVRVCLVNPGAVMTEFAPKSGLHPLLMLGSTSPERVARVIARLTRRPRRTVTVPVTLAPAVALARAFPSLVDAAYGFLGRTRPDIAYGRHPTLADAMTLDDPTAEAASPDR
jgi:short-subunit dehydrogenase